MRCVIVDDSPHFLDAARRLLERDGITVVAVASTGDEALRCVEQLRPDVALIDVDLGGENGVELVERLHRAPGPPPRMILISAEPEFVELTAATHAVGFLAKSALSPSAVRDLLASPTGAVNERQGK